MTKQGQSFEEWASTLSQEHMQVLYEHGPIPNLTQIYFVLLDNIMNKKKYCNPTTLEIIHWIEIGKISEEKILYRPKQKVKENTTYQKSQVTIPFHMDIVV
jgi:hypothetical protein